MTTKTRDEKQRRTRWATGGLGLLAALGRLAQTGRATRMDLLAACYPGRDAMSADQFMHAMSRLCHILRRLQTNGWDIPMGRYGQADYTLPADQAELMRRAAEQIGERELRRRFFHGVKHPLTPAAVEAMLKKNG